MELATRIVGVESRGDWFEFKTEQGFKVSTKHGDIVATAQQLVGIPVVIDYIEKAADRINPHTNQPFVNRYLNSIRPAVAPQANGGGATMGWPGSDLTPETSLPSDTYTATPADKGQIMGRNNIAAASVETLLQFTDGKPETIQRILDGLARWSEYGTPVFASEPVAPTSTDDIPF